MKTCKETAVPNGEFGKHDNVLILIGGTDSDRDWAARIMGFQGTTLTFEQFRERVQRNRDYMLKMHWPFYSRYSRFLKTMDLENPEDMKVLHEFCEKLNLDEAGKCQFFDNMKLFASKPNTIINATVENIKDFRLGSILIEYSVFCTHVGWILDDCSPESLKMPLEKSNSLTEPEYSDEGCPFGEILDGDIWFFFPRGGNDGECENAAIGAVRIKKSGQPMPNNKTIMSMKINKFDADGQLIPGGKHTVDELIGRNE